MRYTYLFSLFILPFILGFVFTGFVAIAQPVPPVLNECDSAKNTADHLACANRMLEDSQTRLNSVFEVVLGQQADENTGSFRTSQKDWILYRDNQCAWEMTQEQNESLKKIQELSCLARLTNLRIAALSGFVSEETKFDLKSATVFPAWVNVLSDENPDVLWQLKDRKHVDLDCDGVQENVLPGLKISIGSAKESGDQTDLRPVLALTTSPASGQPSAKVIMFDFADEPKEASCNRLSLIEVVGGEVSENQPTDQSCQAALKVIYGDCQPFFVRWSEDEPVWHQAPVPESQPSATGSQ